MTNYQIGTRIYISGVIESINNYEFTVRLDHGEHRWFPNSYLHEFDIAEPVGIETLPGPSDGPNVAIERSRCEIPEWITETDIDWS